MSTNSRIAEQFEQIAAMLELTGADSFRASANARAARTIADWSEDLGKIAADREALTAIPGVGAKIADKIQEFVETGKITEREELLKKVPHGLLDILKIPGLGPKTVKAIWETLKVESLDDLKKALDNGSIEKVPRMGAKTIENIRKSISFAETAGERAPLGVAATVGGVIVERLRTLKGVKKAELAGSLRRGKETIGDIDVLVTTNDPAKVSEAFRSMPEVTDVLAAGETKSSVRLTAPVVEGKPVTIQADLRVVPPASFGAALLYFTGSKEHNVRLRERALKRKLTLNEYGLFPLDDEKTPPQQRGVKPVAAATEEEIYAALDLPFIPPEIREDRGELNLKPGHAPKLIEVDDIRAELHAHTTASDGVMSILELAEQAKARGFHTIAVTDHSKSQTVANGLSPERLLEHIDAIHAARGKIKGIHILAGSEVDIRADGTLDYEDDLLAKLDIVVASPHWALKQTPEAATERLVRAASHPLVHILGHPTGRLINRREGLSPDMDKVIAAAKEHNTALEINAHWMRLDLRDAHVRAAMEAGALIAIDCDVHAPDDFDNLRFGVVTARRGWATAPMCVNTWAAKKLHEWLASKRPARTAVRPTKTRVRSRS